MNVKALLAKMLKSDYIEEQGTSGIWTYRKWASGIAECWGRTDIVVPTNGAYAVAFPFTFVEITCNSVNAFYGYSTTTNRQATKYIVTDGSNDGLLDRAVAYVRDYNGNAVSPYIAFDFHTKGLWKTWGGYFLTAFSAIERWWRHVDYQGIDIKDTECVSWSNETQYIVSNCEHCSNFKHRRKCGGGHTPGWLLRCVLLDGVQNNYHERHGVSGIPFRLAGWVRHGNSKSVFLSICNERRLRIFLWKFRWILDGHKPRVDGEHRISLYRCRPYARNKHAYIAIPERGWAVC